MEIPVEFSRKYFVTPGICNFRKELPVTHLISNIIELATDHANILGIGYKYLTPLGLGWVLSRLSFEMKRYPRFDENFTITTWIEDWNRHFSTRNFQVTGEDGEILGHIRTVWVIIDLENHSNAGTTSLQIDNSIVAGRPIPVEPVKRVHHPEPSLIRDYVFRYTDIDFYGHVNTVKYVELLVNQFPISKYKDYFIQRFDIFFRKEARFGEEVKINISEIESDKYVLALTRNSDLIVESQISFGKE